MNELFFRVKNSEWRTRTASALRFDELLESIFNSVEGELKVVFEMNVMAPLDKLYQERYLTIAKPISNEVDRDFCLEIPQPILQAIRPILRWYLEVLPNEGMFSETAHDLLEANGEAETRKSVVYIWGK